MPVADLAIVGVVGRSTPETLTVVDPTLPTASLTDTVNVLGPEVLIVADTRLADAGLTIAPAGAVQV